MKNKHKNKDVIMANSVKELKKSVDHWQAVEDGGGSPTSQAKLAAAKHAVHAAEQTAASKPAPAKKAKKEAKKSTKKSSSSKRKRSK